VRVCSLVDSFIKLEHYEEYKEARWINSRHDRFKAFSGRYIKSIENVVYSKIHAFIKHVPVPERPSLIRGMIRSGYHYYENDYSSWEALQQVEIQLCSEVQLFHYMLANFEDARRAICNTTVGRNQLNARWVKAMVMGRRMSGDMWTSLANGFNNLMVFLFICHEKGMHGFGYVEGDDGLFACEQSLDKSDFAPFRFVVKLKELTSPCVGHFCGNTFSEDNIVMKDPRRVFASFGWTSSFIHGGNQIMDELLRSKALSLFYEMGQCPVLGQLALTAVDLTEGVIVRHHDENYGHDEPPESGEKAFSPSLASRELFENMYGISIQTQLMAEEAIRDHDMSRLSRLIPPGADHSGYAAAYLEVR